MGKVESLQERLPPGTRAVVLKMHRMVLLDTSGFEAALGADHVVPSLADAQHLFETPGSPPQAESPR